MDMDERFFELSRNLPSFAIFLLSLFLVCTQLNSSVVNSQRDSINELIFRIDEEFGLKPKEIGGELVLAIDPSSKKAPSSPRRSKLGSRRLIRKSPAKSPPSSSPKGRRNSEPSKPLLE